jgi:hypothetical protein
MRSGPLPPRRSAEIIAKLARALAVVHAHGITHGDLKPANILIDLRGEPRLIDFGLARERSPLDPNEPEGNQIAGTLLYMSPEQAAGDLSKVGAASDVFGLGTVLYELLVGHPPREAAPDSDMLDQAQKGEVDLEALLAPEIPSRLAAICRQALAPRPADRHATIEALADDLERWQTSLPRDGRRRRLIPVAATAGALTLAIGAALLANSAAQPRQTPGQAAARFVGHQPHHDFALQMDVVGRPADGGVVALTEGDSIALRLQSEVDCYAGVWHIDGAGTITQLFPNDTEQDHYLAANRPLTIPGRDSYTIEVSPGIGPEYLWVACSSRPWSPQAGHERGPAAVLGRSPGKSCQRDAVVVARSGPRVSEAVVQIQVRSAPQPAGKGSELACLGGQ